MKYWLYINDKISDRPYEESELGKVEGFTEDTLICPENTPQGKDPDWRPAKEVVNVALIQGEVSVEAEKENKDPLDETLDTSLEKFKDPSLEDPLAKKMKENAIPDNQINFSKTFQSNTKNPNIKDDFAEVFAKMSPEVQNIYMQMQNFSPKPVKRIPEEQKALFEKLESLSSQMEEIKNGMNSLKNMYSFLTAAVMNNAFAPQQNIIKPNVPVTPTTPHIPTQPKEVVQNITQNANQDKAILNDELAETHVFSDKPTPISVPEEEEETDVQELPLENDFAEEEKTSNIYSGYDIEQEIENLSNKKAPQEIEEIDDNLEETSEDYLGVQDALEKTMGGFSKKVVQQNNIIAKDLISKKTLEINLSDDEEDAENEDKKEEGAKEETKENNEEKQENKVNNDPKKIELTDLEESVATKLEEPKEDTEIPQTNIDIQNLEGSSETQETKTESENLQENDVLETAQAQVEETKTTQDKEEIINEMVGNNSKDDVSLMPATEIPLNEETPKPITENTENQEIKIDNNKETEVVLDEIASEKAQATKEENENNKIIESLDENVSEENKDPIDNIIEETQPKETKEQKDSNDMLETLTSQGTPLEENAEDAFLKTFTSSVEEVFLDQPTAIISDYVPPTIDVNDNVKMENNTTTQDQVNIAPVDLKQGIPEDSLRQVRRIKPAAIKTIPMVPNQEGNIEGLPNIDNAIAELGKPNKVLTYLKWTLGFGIVILVIFLFLFGLASLRILPKSASPLHKLLGSTDVAEIIDDTPTTNNAQEDMALETSDEESLESEETIEGAEIAETTEGAEANNPEGNAQNDHIINNVKTYIFTDGTTLENRITTAHSIDSASIEWTLNPTEEETIFSIAAKLPINQDGQSFSYRFNYNTADGTLTPTTSESKNIMIEKSEPVAQKEVIQEEQKVEVSNTQTKKSTSKTRKTKKTRK